MPRFLADLSVEETAPDARLHSCNGEDPPLASAPSGLAGLTQVAIQPDGIDSCIQCFVVDLYLDEQHPIVAIRLDRFAP